MEIIRIQNKQFIELKNPTCAAIGNFDGVHLAHQILINESKKHNLKSAVITFSPHPSVYLKRMPNYPLITPLDKKIEIIKEFNVDYLIIIEFDDTIASMPKEEFITNLKKMNIKAIVCGYDFSFGRRGEGEALDLKNDFDLTIIKKYIYDDIRVSSTYIRELLDIGNVYEANRLLGREFSIRGEVVYGSQKGRFIGFPTANVDYKNYYLPQNGVYFVNIIVKGKRYLGMCNIGHNPTFNFAANKRMEVNIFDFDEDIYGEIVEVYFVKRIRDEKKFKSVDELLIQMNSDKAKCLEIDKCIKNN